MTFTIGVQKILIKCIYAPNQDITTSDKDNYSNTFFKTVFDNSFDLEYDIKIIVGDYNVAPDHNMDTSEYLQINYPNSRRFLDRVILLNMMTDVGTNIPTQDSIHSTKNRQKIT